ncbi:hypothetical protein DFP72DRAFT_1074104 [Ephemerocybe angulata]|uniref:MYND-type domain-containing protein n=1 Tax=Ephemerocybe angulata TaxID=980116 RepID=A0A8H6HK23_9AGAR|nr:hypothetical protein DFP72DRAFT_1074104 [Tulosesus angulatus]
MTLNEPISVRKHRGKPLKEVMHGARRWSMEHLLELYGRTRDLYSNEILETVLGILEEGAKIPLKDARVEQLDCGTTAFTMLCSFKDWRYTTPFQVETVERRLMQSLDSIAYWADYLIWYPPAESTSKKCAAQRLPLERKPGQNLHRCGIAADGVFKLLYSSKPIAKVAPQSDRFLKLALSLWVITVGGNPVIYPFAKRSLPSHIADIGDTGTLVFNLMATESASGIARIVHGGEFCSPLEFVEKTVARMQAFGRVNSLPHLVHRPDNTVENQSLECIVSSTGCIMTADDSLCSLFSSVQAPELFMEVLVAVNDRLKGSMAHATPHDRGRIVKHLAENLSTTAQVIFRMAKVTKGFFPVVHLRNIINAGLFQLMDDCVSVFSPPQALDGEITQQLAVIFAAMIKFSRFPKVLRPLLSELEHRLAIKSPLLSKDPTLKGKIEMTMPSLRAEGRCLRRKERVTVCDNLKRHLSSAMVVTGSVSWTLPEACSNCHSVVYCSPQCQHEDWNSRHRSECHDMCLDYLERSYTNLSYPYSTRAFHLSVILHTFETLALTVGDTFTSNARFDPAFTEPSRTGSNYLFIPLTKYTAKFEPFIPALKRKRFNDLVEPFRHQISRLAHLPPPSYAGLPEFNLAHSVECVGSFDIHFVVLLRRVRATVLPNALFDYNVQRDPKTSGSDYEIVQALWFFTSPIRCWSEEMAPLTAPETRVHYRDLGDIISLNSEYQLQPESYQAI